MLWFNHIVTAVQIGCLAVQLFGIWHLRRYFRTEKTEFRRAGVETACETAVFWIAVGIRQERNRWMRAMMNGAVAEEIANNEVD